MRQFPSKYLLTIRPKKYLQQGLSHCGVYSVKAILSAYGLDNKSHPKYYHPHWLGRLTGSTFGRQYYINILKNHGVDAEIKSAEKISDSERTILLKKLLSNNTPVMIRIGNGYVTDKYNRIIGRLAPHWITLWGYDNGKHFFYVYDSGLLKQYWKKLPVGNITRSYEETLRDWKFGKWQPYTWPLVGRSDYLYIEVKSFKTTSSNTEKAERIVKVSNGLKYQMRFLKGGT